MAKKAAEKLTKIKDQIVAVVIKVVPKAKKGSTESCLEESIN